MKKIKIILETAIFAIAALFVSCSSPSSGGGSSTKSSPKQQMVFVKGGTIIGADYTNNYTGVFIKNRNVTLSDFYISNLEVTQEEYKDVMTGNPDELEAMPSACKENSATYPLLDGEVQSKRPVENVTWYDAVYFCNQKSIKEGLTCAYTITVNNKLNGHITNADVDLVPGANGYRLPTEAEWEFAARGGDQTKPDWNYTFSGADTVGAYNSNTSAGLDIVGWYSYNLSGEDNKTISSGTAGYGTHEVGKKKPNALGLYDMSGNVWEWCYDNYESSITTGNVENPKGAASGSFRVKRGGSWCDNAYSVSVSYRDPISPHSRNYYFGFRLVRSL